MTQFKARHYNQIRRSGKVIEKKSRGDLLSEYEWYKRAAEWLPANTPKTYQFDDEINSLKMEYIEGKSAYNYLLAGSDIVQQRQILQAIHNILERMSRHIVDIDRRSAESDVRAMYLEKPLAGIDHFLSNYSQYLDFSKQTIYLNGKPIQRPDFLLKDLYKKLESQLVPSSFCFMHGDITLSNIIIKVTNQGFNLFLIDPRGKFGNTKIYGDRHYDFAKVFYSFFGSFDSLNHHKFSLKQDGNKYFLDIPVIAGEDIEKEYRRLFSINETLLNYIHSTIWLSLSPHLEEDPKQTVAAFLKGTELVMAGLK